MPEVKITMELSDLLEDIWHSATRKEESQILFTLVEFINSRNSAVYPALAFNDEGEIRDYAVNHFNLTDS